MVPQNRQRATTTELIGKIFSSAFNDVINYKGDEKKKKKKKKKKKAKASDENKEGGEGIEGGAEKEGEEKEEEEKEEKEKENDGNEVDDENEENEEEEDDEEEEEDEEEKEKEKEKSLNDNNAWMIERKRLEDKSFNWDGDPLMRVRGRTFYRSATNEKGVTVSMGDFVIFSNREEMRISVCRILFMYHENFTDHFHGPCFMLARNSPIAGIARKNELFYTDRCVSGNLSDIIALTKVQWVDLKETNSAAIEQLNCLYWRGKIPQQSQFSFVDPTPEEVAECTNEVTAIKTCLNCLRKRDELRKKETAVVWDEDSQIMALRHNGVEYEVNSFVFVDTSAWERPRKSEQKEYEEYEYRLAHPEVYTEMYRKDKTPYL